MEIEGRVVHYFKDQGSKKGILWFTECFIACIILFRASNLVVIYYSIYINVFTILSYYFCFFIIIIIIINKLSSYRTLETKIVQSYKKQILIYIKKLSFIKYFYKHIDIIYLCPQKTKHYPFKSQ